MHVLVDGCDLGPAAAGIPEVAVLCSNVQHSQAYPIFILSLTIIQCSCNVRLQCFQPYKQSLPDPPPPCELLEAICAGVQSNYISV